MIGIPQFKPRGKTSADIRAEIDELTSGAEAVLDRAKIDDRELTADELAMFDRTLAAIKPLKAELQAVEADENRRLGIAQAQSILNTQPVSPFASVRGDYSRSGAMTQPRINHRLPTLKAFGNNPEGHRDAWLAANWWKAIRTGDQDATAVCNSAGFDVRMTATEGNPGAGGYLVPTPLSNAVIEVRAQAGVARKVCRILPMTSETHSEPKLLSGPTVTYPGEAGEFTASDESWGQVMLTAKKRGILTKVSRELRDDALISVIDHLASRMGHEFALKEDAEFIDGDSTSTFGGVTGVLAAIGAGGVSTALSGNNSWVTLDLEDFTTAMSKLPSKYSERAVWVCSMNFYTGAMLRALANGGGNTMLSLSQGLSEGLFLGKRVLFTDYMPTATATSTIHALYGDFSEAVILGDRQGVEIAVSDQRYFEFDLVGVRGVVRYDFNCHECGDASNPGAVVALKTNS